MNRPRPEPPPTAPSVRDGVGLGLRWDFLEEVVEGPALPIDFFEVVLSSIVRDSSQQEPSDLRIRRRNGVFDTAVGIYPRPRLRRAQRHGWRCFTLAGGIGHSRKKSKLTPLRKCRHLPTARAGLYKHRIASRAP